jgi:hypothetical protein
LIASRFRSVVRLLFVLSVVSLAVLATAYAAQAMFSAGAGSRLSFQDDGYPPPENLQPVEGYPAPGDGGTVPESTQEPFATQTETHTPTPPPDILRTEQAEMGDTLVTPPGDMTPAPTHTLINTVTPTPTQTATPEPAPVLPPQEEGFRMDWGLFSIGFAIPILIGCGLVLYLIDRRPDLFVRRPQA